jgi:phage replication-related protein YjqB (UPF0714/DUF867 family)
MEPQVYREATMGDKYPKFEDLAAGEVEGRDFAVRSAKRNSSIVLIAPHGGKIEPGTSEIVDTIAGDKHSSYCFEGCKHQDNKDLHITSTNFNEPRCLELIAGHETVVAIHGLAGKEDRVDVGGLDATLRAQVSAKLNSAGFSASVVAIGPHAAVSPANICNKGRRGAGVQLELTRSLRDRLRGDREQILKFAQAIQEAIDTQC